MLINLHSTMVLFKYVLLWRFKICIKIYIPLWSYSNADGGILAANTYAFTFHYGPIQIRFCNTGILHKNIFTFHYGPIQITF